MYQNFWTAIHVMVDLETTGLNPDGDSIVEIGARHFVPETPNVIGSFFEITILPISSRRQLNAGYWSETPERRERLEYFNKASHTATLGLLAFGQWLHEINGGGKKEVYMWAKPGHFEWGFLSSYYRELGLTNPIKYNRVVDLRSVCYAMFLPAGLAGFPEIAEMLDTILDSRNFKHIGLADVDEQIRMLQKAQVLAKAHFDGSLT